MDAGRRVRNARIHHVAVLLLVGILSGCSRGGSLPPRDLLIEVTEFSIVPGSISARVGESLTFTVTNAWVLEHNVSIPDPSGDEVALLSVMPGQQGTLQIEPSTPGEWRIICTFPDHAMGGMTATLAVGP
jgi:uncharacterized cupredoxin-like copper-binding protein